MKRSINEICGMVLKAARGAGVPLGHCEDLAKAAGYMAATDPAALHVIADILAVQSHQPSVNMQGDALRIQGGSVALAGPMAVDAIRTGVNKVTIAKARAHVVVFAFFAVHGIAISHRFDDADLIVSKSDQTAPVIPDARPVFVSDQLWQVFNNYAAKTYVPATEASRIAGAGAGLTDND